MSSQDFVVPPRSWDNIHSVAERLRSIIGLERSPYVPVIDILEKVLDYQLNIVRFEVGTFVEMDGAEGLTDPSGHFIQIREDVYEAAVNGDGRARFTVAHEMGHLFLHTGVPLARTTRDAVAPFKRSEPQANQFAAEFLMPRHLQIRGSSHYDIARNHGVSDEAARNRFNFLRGKNLI
ncbi:hypothetical protein JOH52_002813 [Sinorhizobium meliloti]|uniref:ImmA/IrrE family metallo-endopeptidase n=1 Tax=Rhizobium meliloti TaxID=382 RepID=UPI00037C2B62|nr:ImmA/IrrE family metallo-endopeptidase [Sinorhizobium meliloti]MBP2466792.1 hypothetical protein [Sinorhizobium meliloti]MDE3765740.1 ImmA/IrrE family metallo-endopeptidase [Sinorhizobium meliloti]MDE3781636.1 ImmA/IrrE family metallo-endopeptidase [Sinorhizobium meliloti]MDE3783772.1 ImmA/IrrE family metallo-endopeptidase [Sinorhizobium meliloti]MDE3803602.1 ImmA/IrrE family metallo-endopeptidase [Sinorhizobium meliloti]